MLDPRNNEICSAQFVNRVLMSGGNTPDQFVSPFQAMFSMGSKKRKNCIRCLFSLLVVLCCSMNCGTYCCHGAGLLRTPSACSVVGAAPAEMGKGVCIGLQRADTIVAARADSKK